MYYRILNLRGLKINTFQILLKHYLIQQYKIHLKVRLILICLVKVMKMTRHLKSIHKLIIVKINYFQKIIVKIS